MKRNRFWECSFVHADRRPFELLIKTYINALSSIRNKCSFEIKVRDFFRIVLILYAQSNRYFFPPDQHQEMTRKKTNNNCDSLMIFLTYRYCFFWQTIYFPNHYRILFYSVFYTLTRKYTVPCQFFVYPK